MKDLLINFRWQDGLDILIVTYVFYHLYLWLKRKKALRMVLALLALPFFLFLAKWIDLPLSVWGLQNLWAVILLILVVIFQQEIREVLRSFSLLTFFFGRSDILPSKVLDRVVEGAFALAEKGFGGLIVLQQGDDLDAFTHGKTLLDAEVNEDLLVSIFNPQSPLHDGAILLQGDRIRYATALLPVSQSTSLPKQWGTRHRAGIGITEVSDAKCIIISEERKEVLLASGGKAEKMARKEALAEGLSDLRSSQGKKEKRRKGWGKIFENLPLKGFFLFLVALLWIFVIGLRQGEMSLSLPIEYYSIPSHLALSAETPREISVRLRGSQRLLSSLNPDRLRVQVDLSDARPGTNQITLSENSLTVPSGIKVVNFYPQKLRLQIAKNSNPDKSQ
jgi:diadenylate cyclase